MNVRAESGGASPGSPAPGGVLARSVRVAVLAAGLLVVCTACRNGSERASGQAPAEPPLTVRPTGLVAGLAVASAAAFDLVLAPDGPLLVWAPLRAESGGVALRELDAFGEPRSEVKRIVAGNAQAGEVIELAAAPHGSELALIYRVAEPDGGSRTLAALVPRKGPAPAPVRLVASPAELAEGRGRIALVGTSTGPARMMYMAGAAACADAEETAPCVGVGFHELGRGGSARDEPWLSVPAPCPEGALSLAALEQRFFYAVCSWRGDQPVTMAYAINVENYYARADEVLRGCLPRGMVAIDAHTVVLGGDCGPVRRAARLTLDMKPPAEFPLADLTLACERGRVSVTATGWALPFEQPRAELEAILPEHVAPAGARALWTGRALLVAQRMSGRLELARYTCAGDTLEVESSARSARR